MVVSVQPRPLQYSHTIGQLALTGEASATRSTSRSARPAVRHQPIQCVPGPHGRGARVHLHGRQQYFGQFGGFGEDDGGFIWPTSIARDSKGNTYVSDEHRNDVQVFDTQPRVRPHSGAATGPARAS
jgi:hypothetical protein